jgi:formate dehydrogenase subunit gamma
MKRAANPDGPDRSGLANIPDDIRTVVLEVTTQLKDLPGALLPVLHGVQQALGYVPEASVPLIARELNLSRADVHGVITFYQAMGAVALEQHIKQRLGVDFGETTANGAYTLEPVYCLGNCACSPAIMVDDELKGRVTPKQFDAWLAAEAT